MVTPLTCSDAAEGLQGFTYSGTLRTITSLIFDLSETTKVVDEVHSHMSIERQLGKGTPIDVRVPTVSGRRWTLMVPSLGEQAISNVIALKPTFMALKGFFY